VIYGFQYFTPSSLADGNRTPVRQKAVEPVTVRCVIDVFRRSR